MLSLPWNEKRVARLTELWLDGVSAGQIGNDLGVSKNAVVGKAHRMRLPGRPSPILRNVPRATAPVAPAPPQPNPNPAPIAQPGQTASEAVIVRRWHVSQAQSKAEQNIRRENGQKLLPWSIGRQFLVVRGMKFAACQWIAGEPSADDACKCRLPTDDGPYCAEHQARGRGKRQEGEAA